MSEPNISGPGQQNFNNVLGSYTGLVPGATAGVSGYSPGVTGQVGSLMALLNNNPYQQAAQTGSVVGSQYGTGTLSPQQQGAATGGFNTGAQLSNYVPGALAQGFNPNNANYNFGAQQTLDQSNAVNSMNGVAGSPYGAGVTNQALTNYNLGWQNQLLNNEALGASTAANLSGAANAANTGASNLGTAGLNTQIGAAAAPSSTYTQNLNSLLQSLGVGAGDVSTASGATTNVMNSLLQFLGYGTNASAQQAQQQGNALGGLGSFLTGVAGLGTGGGGTLIGDIIG